MTGGDVGHSGALLRRTTAGLVVLVLAFAAAAYSFDLGPRWLGWQGPSPVTAPAEVAPPPGLDLAEPTPALPVAQPVSPVAGPVADPRKVRRSLVPLLRDEDLGRRVSVVVAPLGEGSALFTTGTGTVVPASTLKLLTTTAVLEALGADHTFRTTVVTGRRPDEVVLVGGGDPLLARTPSEEDTFPVRADLTTLADGAVAALRAEGGRTRVRLAYDDTLFVGPSVSPGWPAPYVVDNVVSPVSSLWVDQGRQRTGSVLRVADPAAAAASEFARLLRARGMTVVGPPRATAARPEAAELAAVESAPLDQIVQRTLEVSDNEASEVLLRHVALAQGRPASFAGGAQAVVEVLGRLGVDASGARILDGSGLSRLNRVAPGTLLRVLQLAASDEHPGLRAVAVGLPVAGFTGSLTQRFETGAPAGLGMVRAKTGTLTGVHGLAGLVTDLDGTVLAFVAVADRVKVSDTLDARETLDQMAAALAACACS